MFPDEDVRVQRFHYFVKYHFGLAYHCDYYHQRFGLLILSLLFDYPEELNQNL